MIRHAKTVYRVFLYDPKATGPVVLEPDRSTDQDFPSEQSALDYLERWGTAVTAQGNRDYTVLPVVKVWWESDDGDTLTTGISFAGAERDG